jgi:hypothetical protein
VIAWVLMAVSYALLPAPPAPPGQEWMPVNVNYVYGFSTTAPQTLMPPLAYVLLFAAVLQFVIFWSTHRVLARLLGPASGKTDPGMAQADPQCA